MFAQLADWLLRFRWIILLAVGVTTAVAAAFAVRIDFDFTPQAVFAGNDDHGGYGHRLHQAKTPAPLACNSRCGCGWL